MNYNVDDVLSNFFGVNPADTAKAAQKDVNAVQKAASKTSADISARINELNENIKKDFGTINTNVVVNRSELDKFDGISDVIKS